MLAYQRLKRIPLLALEEAMAECGQGPVATPHSERAADSDEPHWALVLKVKSLLGSESKHTQSFSKLTLENPTIKKQSNNPQPRSKNKQTTKNCQV